MGTWSIRQHIKSATPIFETRSKSRNLLHDKLMIGTLNVHAVEVKGIAALPESEPSYILVLAVRATVLGRRANVGSFIVSAYTIGACPYT